jgi:hypothetical protein
MIKHFFSIILILSSLNAFCWGYIGHRTIGQIAENHLSQNAKRKISRILGYESLAIVSVWMDEQRSNPKYDYVTDWHWVTIPEGKTYEQTEKNENGDIIATINRLTSELKKGGLSKEQENINLKMLVHFIGDVHMPLHNGMGEDMGGNMVKVKWFGTPSNLHRVWDSEIIDDKRLSYTELANALDHPTEEQVKLWGSQKLSTWVDESVALRGQVYNIPEDNYLGHDYMYENWETIELRLLQAGIRLAAVLNEIYK